MQNLLDFLYDNSFDKVIYCVLPAAGGELQLTWRAQLPKQWEIGGREHVQQVPCEQLLPWLNEHGADLGAFERELAALVAAHVVVADHVLAAARDALGVDGVQNVLHAQKGFVRALRAALQPLRSAHLRLVQRS